MGGKKGGPYALRRLIAAAFLSPMAYTLLAGCAVPQTPARVIYEDPANFVRVEKDPTVFVELPHTLHSHPVSISPDQIARILNGFRARDHRTALHIRISGEAPKEPVFRKEEVELLAPRISEALERAEPTERVAYYLSQPQTSIKREITTGGIYVRGNHLHFILGNYHVIYGIPAYGMVYDRRYPIMPTAAKGFDLFFEPDDAVIPQRDGIWDRILGRIKDEVVIDLDKLFSSKPAVKQGANPSSTYRSAS
jgi:hypothetical protein